MQVQSACSRDRSMKRTSFASMTCSVARSLEQIGDWWTMLLVREAFYGTRRFGEFETNLGIAPNILTKRLVKLVEDGIFEVVATTSGGKALEYRLTDKGRDLFPIIVAIAQWGDTHAVHPKGPPICIVERATGEPIAKLAITSRDGRALAPRDVTVIEGPGASRIEKARFAEARKKGLVP
jgi:DNA-binding HxlR family transcriptional regulator